MPRFDQTWDKVKDTDCLPDCFPYDVSTDEVYVLSVACGHKKKHPFPLILTPSHKIRDARLQSTTQECNADQLVVVNVYINLACGKKAAYFPPGGGFGSGYDGIDPADIFLHPRGAISVSGAADPSAAIPSDDVSDIIGVGDLSLDLKGSKLQASVPPACVGDIYLLGTQVNLFLQHVAPCNSKYANTDSYSPILGIDGSSLGGDTKKYAAALAMAFGELTDDTTEIKKTDGEISEFSWGLKAVRPSAELILAEDRKKAFTKAELACKPLAMVITDVCPIA